MVLQLCQLQPISFLAQPFPSEADLLVVATLHFWLTVEASKLMAAAIEWWVYRN